MKTYDINKFPHVYAKSWSNPYKQMSLCGYCTRLFFSMLSKWVLSVIVGGAIGLYLVGLGIQMGIFFGDITGTSTNADVIMEGPSIVWAVSYAVFFMVNAWVVTLIGCVLVIGLIFFFGVVPVANIKKHIRGSREKKPSIIKDYIRAKKDKFCPTIQLMK